MSRSIVEDISDLIRQVVKDLPGFEKMDNEYPEINHKQVHIVNEMWKSTGLRKIHLETGKAQGMDVLHCVLFPDPRYNIPIFGCDIVATPATVTAAIVDVSPVYGTDRVYPDIARVANSFTFKHMRPLPLWSEEIFSPHCKFMRLKSEIDKANYYCVVSLYLRIFCDVVRDAKHDHFWPNVMRRIDDQIWYCKSQKKNDKTLSVLSKWFDREFAEKYIDTILFDEPDAKY
jgi:phycocyanobilin:ferredoxin oxidoreductase|tara:strand:+ start:1925 stop:2614 length:690 start_codon:yes stop_codon:yes gene_type:complete